MNCLKRVELLKHSVDLGNCPKSLKGKKYFRSSHREKIENQTQLMVGPIDSLDHMKIYWWILSSVLGVFISCQLKCADLTSLLTLIQEDIHKKLESIDKDSLESSQDVISQIIEGMLIYLHILRWVAVWLEFRPKGNIWKYKVNLLLTHSNCL